MNKTELILALLDDDESAAPVTTNGPWDMFVGQSVIVRTVTMTFTGGLTEVGPDALVLFYAAWVADSGRWGEALASGTLSEVEPYPDGPVLVGRGAVIDMALWNHPLPRTVT